MTQQVILQMYLIYLTKGFLYVHKFFIFEDAQSFSQAFSFILIIQLVFIQIRYF